VFVAQGGCLQDSLSVLFGRPTQSELFTDSSSNGVDLDDPVWVSEALSIGH
jgi:hypothetical protein